MGRIIAVVFMLPFLYFGAVLAASEFGGEVVELETHDVYGRTFHTSLWIVDLYGDTWLRATDPESVWVQRIRNDPAVFVIRNGVTVAYHAEIVDGFAKRINDGMREKYGRADQIIAPLRDEAVALAIRLVGR